VLVSKSDKSMIDIAIECGYECPGSFTRAFKLAFGSCPTLMRTAQMRSVLAELPREDAGLASPFADGALVN
jgi:AraC-like DNA-binding protein